MSVIKIFHVAVNSSTAETEALRKVRPQRLLLSYFYFRNKPLKQFVEKLGYSPEIMLDSGAYSAWTKGKGIALTDYMKYIEENREYITNFINLDVFGDNEMSFDYFMILKKKGFSPIPVVQYGDDHEEWLHKYYNLGERFIALGGTVPIKNKWEVSEWVRLLAWQYPEIKFHLLGSSSRQNINHCDMYSCDSSTWFMQAIMGKPNHIKGTSRIAKIERAAYKLKKELELVV
ncbi:hypothetical protein [Cytobacillus dafuensis]|uniref:Uncharacterized protein n=1 Tax=Cytobacillus dafuensis TaxID=1742359 RepID=A0A5B8Z4Z2_CYTDA|nr:hypothetical protein [Cytobacillus dafuensis]QED48170.1 hypothetical protein FSZ17_13510 [Cytobacillus dafuensis]